LDYAEQYAVGSASLISRRAREGDTIPAGGALESGGNAFVVCHSGSLHRPRGQPVNHASFGRR
jgi:hypothetical protein